MYISLDCLCLTSTLTSYSGHVLSYRDMLFITFLFMYISLVVFVYQALWLPGSQTELAVVTADFVKVRFLRFFNMLKIYKNVLIKMFLSR